MLNKMKCRNNAFGFTRAVKKIFLLCITMCLCALVVQSQTTYDVFTYTEPKGYKKEVKTGFISYTKSDDKTGAYCIISLYAQSPSCGDLVKDFDNDWAELVVPIGVTAAPQKDNSDEITGWKTYTGAANFEFSGGTSMALLTTAKKDNVNAAVLIVTNAQSFITTDVDAFFNTIKLGKPKPVQSSPPVVNNTISTNSKNKIDLWMALAFKPGVINGGANPYGKAKPDFYAVFNNSDYYPHYPTDGMASLSNTNKMNDSWGKFLTNGNKATIQSKYENESLVKVSSTQYKKENSVFTFYKCASVDGLKLSGIWAYNKDWASNTYCKEKGVCGAIVFDKEGNFLDKGIFVSDFSQPNQYPKDAPGEGTYSINNFTLTLKYTDGRVITKAFSGNLDKQPSTDNKILFIGTNAFYKN